MNPVTRISPISDAEAGRLARGDTLEALADDITSTGVPPAGSRPARGPGQARSRRRRRLLIGAPSAVALAVAGLAVAALTSPGQKVGPVTVGPPQAEAAVLSFTRHGGYLDVIVKNPVADARKYRAEFAKYGLNITLTLVPASPSLVGTLVYFEGSAAIKPITAVGQCYTGGGGSFCPVGVRVPLDFRGSAIITFGRAARPGEHYETMGSVTAPGEAMHGMRFVGKTAAEVIAMLAARHVKVADYWYQNAACEGVYSPSEPGSWYVTGADPLALGEVSLDVSKTWPSSTCTGAGVPAPKPSSSSKAG